MLEDIRIDDKYCLTLTPRIIDCLEASPGYEIYIELHGNEIKFSYIGNKNACKAVISESNGNLYIQIPLFIYNEVPLPKKSELYPIGAKVDVNEVTKIMTLDCTQEIKSRDKIIAEMLREYDNDCPHPSPRYNLRERVAINTARLREKAGYTIKMVSGATGMSERKITNIESPFKNGKIRLDEIEKLTTFYCCDPEMLFESPSVCGK